MKQKQQQQPPDVVPECTQQAMFLTGLREKAKSLGFEINELHALILKNSSAIRASDMPGFQRLEIHQISAEDRQRMKNEIEAAQKQIEQKQIERDDINERRIPEAAEARDRLFARANGLASRYKRARKATDALQQIHIREHDIRICEREIEKANRTLENLKIPSWGSPGHTEAIERKQDVEQVLRNCVSRKRELERELSVYKSRAEFAESLATEVPEDLAALVGEADGRIGIQQGFIFYLPQVH